jgi:hypothetical protein
MCKLDFQRHAGHLHHHLVDEQYVFFDDDFLSAHQQFRQVIPGGPTTPSFGDSVQMAVVGVRTLNEILVAGYLENWENN